MSFTSFVSKAQSQHFVYLQTENKQPFYIVLNSVTYNSSASGYLIIPKLQNSTYNFIVGFPKNEFPTQSLSFVVDDNDKGYLLKNFGASGWGLFDLNSMKVTMASSTGNPSVKAENNTDDFTKTLSEVVNTDLSSVSSKESSIPSLNIKKNIRQIKLLSNRKSASGREMVYLSIDNNITDTITVFFPVSSMSSDENLVSQPKTEKAEKNKIDDGSVTESTSDEKVETSKSPDAKIINADCKDIASDKDFLKLRKVMAAKSTEDGMIRAAEKEFKKRCFSTDNLKNVSMLFFTDKGRYSFFDAAYQHVYDLENFPSLKTLLTDNYYILRFEAMIHK